MVVNDEMDFSLSNKSPQPIKGRKHVESAGLSFQIDWKPSIKMQPSAKNHGSTVFGQPSSMKLEKVCDFPRVYRRENLRLLNGKRFSPRDFSGNFKGKLQMPRKNVLKISAKIQDSMFRKSSRDILEQNIEKGKKSLANSRSLSRANQSFGYEAGQTRQREVLFTRNRSNILDESSSKLPSLAKLESYKSAENLKMNLY